MYLAYKYIRRQYKNRKERKEEGAAELRAVKPARPLPEHDQDAEKLQVGVLADGGGLVDQTIAMPTSNEDHDAPANTAELARERKRKRNYRLKVVFGLVTPFTLQALDKTIIASALPFIAKAFDETEELNWIISSFNLAAAAFLPLWAQMTDIFGRLGTMLVSIVLVLVGSAICTGAPVSHFAVLLLGRGIQGVGAAGVGMCTSIILADRVSLSEYAINWTLFSLVNAASFSVGPVIGGYLTDVSWRWCFAINLPVGVFALFIVPILLRKELLGPQPLSLAADQETTSTSFTRFMLRLSTIDYGGQLLFLWGFGLLILALTWAGGSYAWHSAHVLAPLSIGVMLALSWLLYEFLISPPYIISRMFPSQIPMIPWAVISQRDIGLLFGINFGSGMAMFAMFYFMDLYFTLVQGKTASQGGISLLFFLPGLGGLLKSILYSPHLNTALRNIMRRAELTIHCEIVGAWMAFFAMNIWPCQTMPVLLFGCITSAVGITAIQWAIDVERTSVIYGMMALTGHGVGMRMVPASIHGLAYFPTKTSTVSFLSSFALPFGGVVSLTLMSTVFNNTSGMDNEDSKRGIKLAFVALIPFMWIFCCLALILGNAWIRKDGKHDVVNGIYLWHVLRRKVVVKESRTRGDFS